MFTRLCSVLVFGAFVIFSTAAIAKDFGKEAETFIQTMGDRALSTFRTVEDEVKLEEEFRVLLNDGFDVRAIGKWVLGRHWRKAKPEEKEEYLSLFENFIIATYSNRFKNYSGEDITFKVTESLAKNDKDAIVRTQIIRPEAGDPIVVDWRVKENKSGAIKVVDVKIAGVSMSQTQRSEFASVIKRNGGKVAGLIEALRTKTSQMVENVNKVEN